jgi:hypothetical protein
MASMQICYKDPVTKQYVCETRNVYSTTAQQTDTTTTKGKPDKAAIQDKAMQMIREFLQSNPDYFTLTYVAADD